MMGLKEAKEHFKKAEEDLELHMEHTREWTDALLHAKGHIRDGLKELEGVEEEKHHPMEIRSPREIRAEIKRQDDAAKREMYGGK